MLCTERGNVNSVESEINLEKELNAMKSNEVKRKPKKYRTPIKCIHIPCKHCFEEKKKKSYKMTICITSK